ncbi:Hpt domain-containing protein [Reinekea sp.]|jgi:chemosensory pili system protein ChpA (sensor histidine kinase/response regulator)|uniref:hybrid sensor histidine kinase/response regulator n=1 Tax=Reinekea sp. TaxID=1970455 RepID=UPI002A839184|nr:Hpt domain-containing protein [Reinekea sp.]
MADRRDYVALEWVKGEIHETLKQARYALEAFVEAPDDTTRLDFSLSYIHQVYGTLQMVEFSGAALLAHEMEQLNQAIVNRAVPSSGDNLGVLMQAIIQLPNYLDQLKQGQHDLPIVLLPLLNDLRAARGETLLSETSLFSPDLAASRRLIGQPDLSSFGKSQTAQLIRKLRQMYQLALLGWLKGEDLDSSLEFLAKSVARVASLTERAPIGSLWRVVDAFVTGIKAGHIERSAATVKVMRDVDREFKALSADPLAVAQTFPADSLLKNLLFYIAKMGPSSLDRIDRVQRLYRLVDALPPAQEVESQRARLSGPDNEAVDSVVTALLEELSRLKDALDLMVRTQVKDGHRLHELSVPIQQLCDTMALVGLDNPRRVLTEQLEIIAQAEHQPTLVNDALLLDIAGAFLYVEATLSGIVFDSDLDSAQAQTNIDVNSAHRAVVREARNGIEQVKDSVVEYIGAHFNPKLLTDVPAVLGSIRGGLEMVPLADAARVLTSVQTYMQDRLIAENYQPNWQEMDALADALVGVEYYLERIARDGSDTNLEILQRAANSLTSLGLTIRLNQSPELAAVPKPVDGGPQRDDLASEPEVLSVIDEWEDVDAELAGIDPLRSASDPLEELSWDTVIELDEISEAELALEDDLLELSETEFDEAEFAQNLTLEAGDFLVEAAAAIAELDSDADSTAPLETVPNEPEVTEADDDDDLIDDEILEIFVEEAEEVLAAINEFVPQYKADTTNKAALTEFRRGFHTLKGSGRMVRATVIGETAWAVENMLNRMIDGSIPYSADLMRVVEEVAAAVPALVKAFEMKLAPDSATADLLAQRAHAIAKGEPVTWPEDPAEAERADAADAPLAYDSALDLPHDVSEPIDGADAESSREADLSLADDSALDLTHDVTESELARAALVENSDLDMALEITDEGEDDRYVIELTDSEAAEFEAEFAALEGDPFGILDTELEDLDDFDELSALSQDDHSGPDEQRGSPERETGSSDDIDSNLIRIFKNELDSHLEFIDNYLADNPLGRKLPDALQRALHTIKGSAHMASMDSIAEVVMPLEMLVKELQERGDLATPEFLALLLAMVVLVKQSAGIGLNDRIPLAQADYIERVHALRRDLLAANAIGDDEDVSLMSIFLSESMDIVMDAEGLLDHWRQNGEADNATVTLVRELDTLARAALSVDLLPLSQLSNELRSLYLAAEANAYMLGEKFFTLAHDGHESLISMMDRIAAGQSIRTDALFSERLQQLYAVFGIPYEVITPVPIARSVEPVDSLPAADSAAPILSFDPVQRHTVQGDAELVEIFLEEANDILESIQQSLEGWIQDPQNTIDVETLQRDLHTLKGGARMAEILPLGDLAHELEFLYEGLAQGKYQSSAGLIGLLQQCHDRLATMVGDIESSMTCMSAPDLVAAITYFRKHPGSPAQPVTLTPVADSSADLSASIDLPSSTPGLQVTGKEALPDDLDFDILEIFIEEAGELLNELENAIEEWRSDIPNEAHADEMKRVLHTLKGGSRLARLKLLGDLSHDFETHITRTQQHKEPLNDAFFNGILARQDEMVRSIEQLQALIDAQGNDSGGGFGPSVIQMASELNDAQETDSESTPTSDLAAVDADKLPSATVLPFKSKDALAAQNREDSAVARRVQPQETVKVAANLLEGLVNLAGETSISRARLEQEVSDFSYTLVDMDQTIDRLRDHVRRLDMETEAQIIFRQERAEETNYEDFDPLEMDRYSQIQQLSRSLMEATYDLHDIKTTLTDKTRDAETILLQQSRINTELQEGLMRTRMVPFNRLVPRLRRIVRQVAGDLAKNVDFVVGNAEGEVDRTVLERMIAPLEHLLRNAVDHGIETPEARLAANKNSQGTVRLDLSREGSDIVLSLEDDGKGIDVDRIRAKAIERGMMTAESNLNEAEIMQFILEAGFSTADKITQISGRGVGMDVVNSEVKQLGGSIYIDSQFGRGSAFTIRLPFTVSVNRALMVNTLDDLYALPLTSIEGIVRVTPKQLAEYYQPNAPLFEYNGKRYRLEYMGSLLHTGARPNVAALESSVPLVLVKGSDERHSMALHVDQLMGSREIVVKTLGAQFSKLQGVSGATILGDGSVVIILDLSALIRSELVIEHQNAMSLMQMSAELDRKKEGPPRIMVCDDSVTVRKVTSRLLERNGMDVMLAKHGADAISQMIDEIPDLILLDIEMPYMDGFEVASRVRHDDRLRHIPIIMITSRTGNKHRERALSIGVNDYMGKPFQEGPLLDTIERLLKG